MQANMIEEAIGTLETLLVHERELLLRGRARETAALVGEKMSALQVFDDVVLNRAAASLKDGHRRRVEAIVDLAKENAEHFKAVRNGVRSAIDRIGARTESAYVGAYNATGGQTPFRNATGGYLKKV